MLGNCPLCGKLKDVRLLVCNKCQKKLLKQAKDIEIKRK